MFNEIYVNMLIVYYKLCLFLKKNLIFIDHFFSQAAAYFIIKYTCLNM